MKSDFKILVVEDSESFRESLLQLLGVYNDVEGVPDLASAKESLEKGCYDVVILDKRLPDGDGMTLISGIKSDNPNTVVIILTEDGEQNSAKKCMLLGADDYVVKSKSAVADLLVRIPFVVERAADARNLLSLKDQVRQAFRYEIIGSSPSTIQLREQILQLKGTRTHVLITGESGTGKELIARRVNALSDEKQRPFVVINCGAIPANLIESELFGHQKGTFTGAYADKPGKFELAHGGDIFLDEIGDLPLEAQTKILRVIQDGAYYRVGGTKPIQVSCRVIAATNKDLEEMVRRKQFREDLFYRLNVFRIHTTPLRLRLEDVPLLSRHLCRDLGGPALTISDRAIKKLQLHEWPGNIRELRNVLERAFLRVNYRARVDEKSPSCIELEDVDFDQAKGPCADIRALEAKLPVVFSDLTRDNYEAFMQAAERTYLSSAMELSGKAEELAGRLDFSRSTIFNKLAASGIPRRHYRASADPSSVKEAHV